MITAETLSERSTLSRWGRPRATATSRARQHRPGRCAPRAPGPAAAGTGRTSSAARQVDPSSPRPPLLAPLDHQGHHDDHRQDGVDQQRAGGVPGHPQLEHAEGDGAGRHQGEVGHAPDEEGGQGPQEDAEAEGRARPGRPRIPARRKVATKASSPATAHTSVWSRSTGTPSISARWELVALARMATPSCVRWRNQARASDAHRHHDHGDDVVGAEHDARDGELGRERGLDAGGEDALVGPEPGHEQGGGGQQLGQADGGHGEDQPGRPAEPADDDELHQGPDREGGDQADGHGHGVAPAPGRHQHQHEHRRDPAQVGLGEVEDAVGAVDQGHAQRDQGGEATDEHAPHEDAQRAPGRGPAGRPGWPGAAAPRAGGSGPAPAPGPPVGRPEPPAGPGRSPPAPSRGARGCRRPSRQARPTRRARHGHPSGARKIRGDDGPVR